MAHQRSAFSTLLLTLLTCTTLAAAELATPAAHYVTLETIRQSLPAAPIVVGFDIDDTVIFSSPGYSFGAQNSEAPGGKNRYGDDYLNNPQFWKDLNQNHDRYSIKKKHVWGRVWCVRPGFVPVQTKRAKSCVDLTRRNNFFLNPVHRLL